jgi:hypothetical protein
VKSILELEKKVEVKKMCDKQCENGGQISAFWGVKSSDLREKYNIL